MSDNRSSFISYIVGFLIGGLIGAVVALLLAPQSGEETRAQIRDKSLEFKGRAEEGILEARQVLDKQISVLQEQTASLQKQVANLQGKIKAAAVRTKPDEAGEA